MLLRLVLMLQIIIPTYLLLSAVHACCDDCATTIHWGPPCKPSSMPLVVETIDIGRLQSLEVVRVNILAGMEGAWLTDVGLCSGSFGYCIGSCTGGCPVWSCLRSVANNDGSWEIWWGGAPELLNDVINIHLMYEVTICRVGITGLPECEVRCASVAFELPGGNPCVGRKLPVASFKSLNVIELGRSAEETFDGPHMVGGVIRFDPTASHDSDGEIIKYEWDFDNGTKFSPNEPNIYDVTFQEARIYNVTLTVTDNDGLTNTFVERLDLTLKEGDLIFIRTAWWNKPFNIVGHDYTHVGMYTEGQWMIESILTENVRSNGWAGVVQTPVSGWSYHEREREGETFATLVRVKTANDKIRQMAVAFAQSKLFQGYDLKVRKKSVNRPNYYCSELIWAAYYKASKLYYKDSERIIDLGNKGKKGGVWPDDIINDAVNTQIIGYHWEHNP